MGDVEHKTAKVVLVVEDDTTIQGMVAERLLKEGFRVIHANDGSEGFAIATEQKPDLIILDIMMPHNGLGMLKKLRNDCGEYGRKVPVILLTNVSSEDPDSMRAIIDCYPAYYLVKADSTPQQVAEHVCSILLTP